jgi:hypothetical protein
MSKTGRGDALYFLGKCQEDGGRRAPTYISVAATCTRTVLVGLRGSMEVLLCSLVFGDGTVSMGHFTQRYTKALPHSVLAPALQTLWAQ